MKEVSLSEEIEKLNKKDFSIKSQKMSALKGIESSNTAVNVINSECLEKEAYRNLPQVRKVAIAKRRTKFVMLVALFVSCFSISVYIGFFGTFLLFK